MSYITVLHDRHRTVSDPFLQLCVVLRIFNLLNPCYHCPFLYDDAEETVMKGLCQTQRQTSRPRENHRDANSAQDTCSTEEKAELRAKGLAD